MSNPVDMNQINQAAMAYADAEYDRLVAAGWSRRDAARQSRDAERMHRETLILTAQTTDDEG